MNSAVDRRYDQLVAWLVARIGGPLAWETVSADASRRRYFRARRGGRSWIAVDAPPEYENVAAFVAVARLLHEAGLNAPQVLHHDAALGFMCLSDLGDRTYLSVLDDDNADALFGAAVGALLDWQGASRPGVLPDYDRATFAREMALFKQWYIAGELGHELSARDDRAIDGAFDFILDRLATQPPVYVHRDYMPRNLMACQPLPGVIDFQDARYGPAAYDVASLFRDAFVSWPAARVDGWIRHYWDGAIGRGLPVAADWASFREDIALTGAQRHLKILGLFVRIARRDGKPRYADDLDRFRDYLRPVVAGFDELAPLGPFIEARVR
ncbi:aminoglycoside phosphotransferase family protein [Salinisphaera sp. LB1]|uniref:aminoglycoside phosphotransferase family protein n=1 Tax=Salinisphaera sp. LB1 TaxID=2183911 RepID=UPI000D7E86F8|nr:phosphotransferase [Salinisphaera sp. LB1]AWN16302.1 putative phosphotransferase related to Ser/Thr protein kinase [Salinisphaera sp. LB1]